MRLKAAVIIILISVLSASWANALQRGKKGEDSNVRSVQGVVEDQQGSPVEGAVVQLKNTKSLQVRSFITKREGSYYFHGLSPDMEYELKAAHGEASSPLRRLTVFDSRKTAIVNLKLESKQ